MNWRFLREFYSHALRHSLPTPGARSEHRSIGYMNAIRLRDLANRLESAERRSRHLKRLLQLGQVLTTEATKADWAKRVPGEVLAAASCSWAAFFVAGREVDRYFLHQRKSKHPHLTVRPAGFTRSAAGDVWNSIKPCKISGSAFGLNDEGCWYLPVRAHNRVLGGLVLPQACLPQDRCGDGFELLTLLCHQVSLAAELSKLHSDLVMAATFDRMTGALNRNAWLEQVQQRLTAVQSENIHGGLILLDLDNFKEINDSLGHAMGDQYLVEASQAAYSALRAEDLFCRFGGDEFTIWLEGMTPTVLNAVVERLMLKVGAVASKYQQKLPNGAPNLGLSVGVVHVGKDCCSKLDALLESVDAALYGAKAAGRGTWRLARDGGTKPQSSC